MKSKSRLIQKTKHSLPEIGQLVKLRNYKPQIAGLPIRLGSLSDESEFDPDYPPGTIVLVVGIHRSLSNGTNVPIVMAGNNIGWIFADEWEKLEEV